MKPRSLLLLAALLLAGCVHPDGRKEAAATQSALTRTADAIQSADAANAQAQTHTTAAGSNAQRIDDKAVVLEHANW